MTCRKSTLFDCRVNIKEKKREETVYKDFRVPDERV